MLAGSELAPTAERPRLIATEIHRHFEGLHAVDGVSIDVPAGGKTGLVGPHGAGAATPLSRLTGPNPATTSACALLPRARTRSTAYNGGLPGAVRTVPTA